MTDTLVMRLRWLCSPSAESLSDHRRITGFIREGREAADEIERLTRERDEALDTTWFWQIVDRDGLNNVSSDELRALDELVRAAARAEAAERERDALRAEIARKVAALQTAKTALKPFAETGWVYAQKETAHLSDKCWAEARSFLIGEYRKAEAALAAIEAAMKEGHARIIHAKEVSMGENKQTTTPTDAELDWWKKQLREFDRGWPASWRERQTPYVAARLAAQRQKIVDEIERLTRERDEVVALAKNTEDRRTEQETDGGLSDECRSCGCQHASWKAHHEKLLEDSERKDAALRDAKEALRPFAEAAAKWKCDPDGDDGDGLAWGEDFPIKNLRDARAALAAIEAAMKEGEPR